MNPRPEILRYVESICPGARIEPVAGDASNRRFWRVRGGAEPSRIVMDYGSSFEGETDDVRLARVFRGAGLPVAEVLDVSGPAGCLLLEDLGSETMESAFADPAAPDRRALIERAVALAGRVSTDGTAALARSPLQDGPALDADRFRFEMDFFLEHYSRGFRGIEPHPDLRSALHALAGLAAETPRRVLCHRDYHSRNLMLRADGTLAMVDIQDARWGPDSYDLASILRDAYIDVDETWVDPMIEAYLGALDDPPDTGSFRHRFDIVAAQRMIKALGTFGYQCTVRGERRYRSSIERTAGRLRRLLPAREATRTLMEAGLLANE